MEDDHTLWFSLDEKGKIHTIEVVLYVAKGEREMVEIVDHFDASHCGVLSELQTSS